MAIRSLNQLKKWFQKGCYPTAAQFGDWMDSFFHKNDTIPVTSVDGLAERLNDKYNAADAAALEAKADALAEDLAAYRAESIFEHRSINDNIEELDTEDERLARLISDEAARAADEEDSIRSDFAAADAAALAEAQTYADSKIDDVVDGAPATLGTLRKLAEAVGNDPGFAAAVTEQFGSKVDKVQGKGLSTEDFTSADRQKLADIAPGANNYEHPASHPAAIIDQDAEHRFVSDDEKTVWNSALTSASVKRIAGPMTAEEFAALTPDAQTLYIITD
ncbi:MAG: hypothetical protein HFJ82_02825 [Alistipes sp.]|jgi:protein required for attachment to host cells|uniref:hypothetical protein n=1 Tax=uncultured Alistipes sp. TaxID=538949 RepID=UPI002596FA9C|nr:hypothetical protein [uncultured Alistipes sp.]MCI9244424.1 hypothetical protein [Alistipes sp.]